MVFDKYAKYYDLLYQDKDYAAETGYIDHMIKTYQPGAKEILDLGCGTGNHAFCLAEKGYRVTGVDQSRLNIERACTKLVSNGTSPSDMQFLRSDIRDFSSDRTYDVVISLFHVMSYLNQADDVRAAFHTAKSHLQPGGLFIFDCWYGPAVLTQGPGYRVKKVENETKQVIRITEPELRSDENIVVVNFHMLIIDKTSNKVSEVRETHRMRYFFKPEIDDLLAAAGFTPIDCLEWMTQCHPSPQSWNVCFIQRCSAE